jgi:hypothetical protein
MRSACETGSETPSARNVVWSDAGSMDLAVEVVVGTVRCSSPGRRSVRVEGRRLCAVNAQEGGACEGSRDFVARAVSFEIGAVFLDGT